MVFEKYRVIRRIAIGGMGEIFLAHQHGIPGFKRPVILKSLLPELARDAGFIDQFLDEARIAARLSHPNIVAIYEVGQWEGRYFIAMEYIRGVTLSGLLQKLSDKGELMPPGIVARIIQDIALGLDHAHHAADSEGQPFGIVHRDVSPQNIMLSYDGVAKVLDFGIAKAANRSTRTATGNVKGKLGYMAPEQLAERGVDGRSDQFSLGVVAWELCTGTRLFRESDPLATIRKILEDPIPRPAEIVEGLPLSLDILIMRMLQRNPDDRFGRLRDAVQTLRDYFETTSNQVALLDVARFIEATCPEDLREPSALATDADDNFLVAVDAEEATVAAPAGTRRRPWRTRLVSRLAALLGVAAIAAGVALVTATSETPAPEPKPPPSPTATKAPILHLSSTPDAATVRLDDRILGTTPISLDGLAPNRAHRLVVEKQGFAPHELTVSLAAGSVQSETVTLRRQVKATKQAPRARHKPGQRAPPAKPAVADTAPGGYISIATTPWTKVFADDAFLAETIIFKQPMPAGMHSLRLVNKAAGIDRVVSVEVHSGKVTKLNLDLRGQAGK